MPSFFRWAQGPFYIYGLHLLRIQKWTLPAKTSYVQHFTRWREETLISLTIASAMSGEELLAGLYFNDVQGSWARPKLCLSHCLQHRYIQYINESVNWYRGTIQLFFFCNFGSFFLFPLRAITHISKLLFMIPFD